MSIATWEFESPPLHICGNSSVGRAQPCQGWGREFESRFPLSDESSHFDWIRLLFCADFRRFLFPVLLFLHSACRSAKECVFLSKSIRHNLCRFLVNVYFYPTFPAATVVSDWRIAVVSPKKKRLPCTNLHISAQRRANTVQEPCKIKDTWLP